MFVLISFAFLLFPFCASGNNLSLGKPVTNVSDLDLDMLSRFRSFYEDNKSLNSCNAIASLAYFGDSNLILLTNFHWFWSAKAEITTPIASLTSISRDFSTPLEGLSSSSISTFWVCLGGKEGKSASQI